MFPGYDPFGVGRGEPCRRRPRNAQGIVDRQGPLSAEDLAQALTLEQLGHRIDGFILGPEIMNRENVRVGKLGDRLGLALEARDAILARGHPLGLPHPTLADLVDDAVVAEGAIDEVSHCQGSQLGYGSAALRLLRGRMGVR
jgi:hypothetical protein